MIDTADVVKRGDVSPSKISLVDFADFPSIS